MEPLPLDPNGYGGSYKLVGNRPSLDFVNTVSRPLTWRRHDWLDSPANLRRWAAAVGMPMISRTGDVLAAVPSIRTALDDVLRPVAVRSKPSKRAVDRFNEVLGAASGRRRLSERDLSWAQATPKTAVDVFDTLILDAADILASDHERLRTCPDCDWLFEDHTRNGQRRWCDMADCGSRAKAREYYHRHNPAR